MQNLIWKLTIFALWPALWVLGVIVWTVFCFVTWPVILFAEILLADVAVEFEEWWSK